MTISETRLSREEETFRKMAGIYCRNHHSSRSQLCQTCEEMVQYVTERVSVCPYGDEKPVCGKCPAHCFTPEMRDKVRLLMAFAGPRMMVRHPILAIRHCVDMMKA